MRTLVDCKFHTHALCQANAAPFIGTACMLWVHVHPSDTRAAPFPLTAMQVFGLPSVRVDIPEPLIRSVANTQNFGNEPTALQLLLPPKCVDLGVQQEHLLQPRSRQELQELLGEAGVGMAEDEFEAVFGLAVAVNGAGLQECSLEELMQARTAYLKQAAGLM